MYLVFYSIAKHTSCSNNAVHLGSNNAASNRNPTPYNLHLVLYANPCSIYNASFTKLTQSYRYVSNCCLQTGLSQQKLHCVRCSLLTPVTFPFSKQDCGTLYSLIRVEGRWIGIWRKAARRWRMSASSWREAIFFWRVVSVNEFSASGSARSGGVRVSTVIAFTFNTHHQFGAINAVWIGRWRPCVRLNRSARHQRAWSAFRFVFLPFHSSILKPYFNMPLCQIQHGGQLNSPWSGNILVKMKFLFQLQQLASSVGSPRPLVFVFRRKMCS